MRVFTEFEDHLATNGAGDKLLHESELIRRNLSPIKATVVYCQRQGRYRQKSARGKHRRRARARRSKVGIMDADLNAPSILQMLGTKAPLRYLSSEGIEPAAAPLGIRVASSELLSETLRPAMSFLDEDPAPAPCR